MKNSSFSFATTNYTGAPRCLSAILSNAQMALALFASSLVVFITIHSLRQKRLQGLPCWPFLGMLPSLVMGLREPCLYQWITEILQAYGKTFTFKGPRFSGYDFVLIWDPPNVEHLLKTKFANFPKGPYFCDTSRYLFGDGILNADGDVWRRQRNTMSIEMFHSPQFRDQATDLINELVHSRLLPYLELSVQNSVSIDLQEILLRLTFDNVCTLAFGVDPHTLAADGLPDFPFCKAFQNATEASALGFAMPTCVWKALRYFNLGTEKGFRESIAIVDDFAYGVIQQRKKELAGDRSSTAELKTRKDLLTVFMDLQETDGKPYSDKLLRDICISFIFAGRESSSLAMGWFFWLIYRNPRAEENIMKEIMQIVGRRKDMAAANKNNRLVFAREEVEKMVYLHAALSESLRFYPTVPLDFKQVIGKLFSVTGSRMLLTFN